MKTKSTKNIKTKGRPKKDVKNKENFNILRDRLIQERKMTLEDLSIKTNISKSSLNAFETGDRQPTLDNLISISNALNIPIDYLVGLQNQKSKDLELSYISKYVGINENSIINLKRLEEDEETKDYLKYIDEILFNYYNFENLMAIIKDYFDYEKYDDKKAKLNNYDENDNDDLVGNIEIERNDMYLLGMNKLIQEIKESTSISEKKYIRIIKELNVKIEEEKKNNFYLNEYVLIDLKHNLKTYESLLSKCERVRSQSNNPKLIDEYVKSEYEKEKKNGKK